MWSLFHFLKRDLMEKRLLQVRGCQIGYEKSTLTQHNMLI